MYIISTQDTKKSISGSAVDLLQEPFVAPSSSPFAAAAAVCSTRGERRGGGEERRRKVQREEILGTC